MRITHTQVQVAAALMADPNSQHWGYELAKHAHVSPRAMYGVLSRWLKDDWLTDGWEAVGTGKKRPLRRYYQLTELGAIRLGALLVHASNDARFATHNLKPGVAQ